jgi:hypothetical protein
MTKAVYDVNGDNIVDTAAALSTAGAAHQFWKNGNSWAQVDYTDLTSVPAIPAASATNPVMDGTVAIGSLTTYAKADHVHPSDTSRMAVGAAPTAHAPSHKSGGSDVLGLDTLGATTDVTTLNSSATAHGLLPKLSNVATQYLNGVGAFGAIAYSSLTGAPSIPTVGTLTTASSITGGGAMTGNLTINLVGDTATPGANAFYGYVGSARGWFGLAYSMLSGTPAIPTVGTLTTTNSVTGGGVMTGNLTVTLLGDVVTPTNGQFYGYSGSARGWFTPPTNTGPTGPPGTTGPQGGNAYTTTTANFTVPNVNASTTVTVADASWVVVGEMVWVDTAAGGVGQGGAMQVTAKAGNTLTLLTTTTRDYLSLRYLLYASGVPSRAGP